MDAQRERDRREAERARRHREPEAPPLLARGVLAAEIVADLPRVAHAHGADQDRVAVEERAPGRGQDVAFGERAGVGGAVEGRGDREQRFDEAQRALAAALAQSGQRGGAGVEFLAAEDGDVLRAVIVPRRRRVAWIAGARPRHDRRNQREVLHRAREEPVRREQLAGHRRRDGAGHREAARRRAHRAHAGERGGDAQRTAVVAADGERDHAGRHRDGIAAAAATRGSASRRAG